MTLSLLFYLQGLFSALSQNKVCRLLRKGMHARTHSLINMHVRRQKILYISIRSVKEKINSALYFHDRDRNINKIARVRKLMESRQIQNFEKKQQQLTETTNKRTQSRIETLQQPSVKNNDNAIPTIKNKNRSQMKNNNENASFYV